MQGRRFGVLLCIHNVLLSQILRGQAARTEYYVQIETKLASALLAPAKQKATDDSHSAKPDLLEVYTFTHPPVEYFTRSTNHA
jgi:hypothetical protein